MKSNEEKKQKEGRLIGTTYVWWKDKKMVGTIILLIAISVQIFSWLKVPFLSSINGYTVGMLMGFYNPLVYGVVIIMALKMIFPEVIKKPKWFRLNAYTYSFLVISILFISVSTSFYQSSGGYTTIGIETWNRTFSSWFNDYTNSKSAWVPEMTNGGIIGAFMYSFFTMISSGIGALIISIVLLIINFSFIASGSAMGLYRQLIVKHNLSVKEEIRKEEKQYSVDDKIAPVEKTKIMPIEEKDKNSFPFEDPF